MVVAFLCWFSASKCLGFRIRRDPDPSRYQRERHRCSTRQTFAGAPVGLLSCSPHRASVTLLSTHRNEDLKEMLESSKESLKLEAMKRVVGVSASQDFSLCINRFSGRWIKISVYFQLIAKGKNASELFPAVVKNVASKNIEV